MEKAHSHLITIDQEAGYIRIFRILPSGEQQPYTMFALPEKGMDKKRLQALAQILGEDILADSPVTRSLYG
jgi:hypothetical protein